MKIATVIVIFGKSQHLQECQKSLKDNALKSVHNEIIVVDNTIRNVGFTGGNNKGIRQALQNDADAVLLLNDDTKVDIQAIQYLSDTLSSDSKIGMVVPKIYFYPGYEFHKDRYEKKDRGKVIWYAGGKIDWNNAIGSHIGVDDIDHGQHDTQTDVDFATGCCVLIRREIFEKVGFFDDRYFLYLEDLDFSVRVKRAGFRIIYEPKAVVWHKNAQSSGSGSALHEYFFTRNRLLFGMLYSNFRTKFALLREGLKFFLNGSTWKRKAVLDFLSGRFGRGSWMKDER